MDNNRKSIFDRIKDKPTLWMLLEEIVNLANNGYKNIQIDRCAVVICIEIATHCPLYRFILDDEAFKAVIKRSNLWITTPEINHLDNLTATMPSRSQRRYVSMLRQLLVNGTSPNVASDMLSAINDQAYILRINEDQFRSDILPFIKLAIAYAEAE